MKKSRHIHNLVAQFVRQNPKLWKLTAEDAALILEAAGFITVNKTVSPWRYVETPKMKDIPPYDFPDLVIKILKEASRERED